MHGRKKLQKKTSQSDTDTPPAVVPNPELLEAYGRVSPDLPALVVKEWGHRHRRSFIYATTSLVGGILVACGLIGGFVYLTIEGHATDERLLLGSGVLGIIGSFLAARFN